MAKAEQAAAYANQQALDAVGKAQAKAAAQDEQAIQKARTDGARSVARAQQAAAYANQQAAQQSYRRRAKSGRLAKRRSPRPAKMEREALRVLRSRERLR